MKISWYDHLYVGDKAKKKRYQIIQSIRNSRLISGAYVIREDEFFIIGIAADYWEALEVTRQIVEELYQNTGGFDLTGYLNGRPLRRSHRDDPAQGMSEHVPEAGRM